MVGFTSNIDCSLSLVAPIFIAIVPICSHFDLECVLLSNDI